MKNTHIFDALNALRSQRDTLTEAIELLEKLDGKSVVGFKKKKTAKRNWSAASRKAAAMRMKRYWAERKKSEKR